MTVTISDDNRNYEFHDVPVKVAKAVITILNECANNSSDVVPCITEKWIPIEIKTLTDDKMLKIASEDRPISREEMGIQAKSTEDGFNYLSHS